MDAMSETRWRRLLGSGQDIPGKNTAVLGLLEGLLETKDLLWAVPGRIAASLPVAGNILVVDSPTHRPPLLKLDPTLIPVVHLVVPSRIRVAALLRELLESDNGARMPAELRADGKQEGSSTSIYLFREPTSELTQQP
ncbi:hypothetical protein MKZ38_005185 [Zalerion maritima]|uniref:Uncharacterized protein n=1 Tax=Zalerion maritima TaxID=339359 RepID=A0AAD5RXK0_9PEZI|nr:hypothetical protein MKZ38_005185 [Zalerion maritima]